MAKFSTSLKLVIFLLTSCTLNAYGQTRQIDYFPKITIGLSTGYFNSFIDNFEKENTQEPLFGINFGYELLNMGGSAFYGVFRFNHFVARLSGRELIKWQQDHFNFGFRFSIAQSFLARPNAQLWISTGLSLLDLSRKDFKTRSFLIWEGGRSRKISIDESTIETWFSKNYYLEIGQIIPFEMSTTPNFAFVWSLKYDQGRDANLNIGGFSFILGFNFAAIYSQ
jgi:hypothetical protein